MFKGQNKMLRALLSPQYLGRNRSNPTYGPIPQNVFDHRNWKDTEDPRNLSSLEEDDESVLEKTREEDLQDKIISMRQQISEKMQALDDLKTYRSEALVFWTEKMDILESDISRGHETLKDDEDTLRILLHPSEEQPPQGPRCLRFLDGNIFNLFATFVIVGNVVIMVKEMMGVKTSWFWYADQAFMCFYVVELFLKTLLYRKRLLCGHIGTVWWNWLDLIVVFVGVLDQWVSPMVFAEMSATKTKGGMSKSSSSSALQMIRLLRLARLARMLKIVRVFLRSDLSWAEGTIFQMFIMSVIGFNSLLMSFETDYPSFFLWVYVEQVLLIIFSFELLVRLKLWGLTFFTRSDDLVWNILDFVIVVGGVIDQWMMPAIALMQALAGMESAHKSGSMGQVVMMLRMARLLRILRLVRLVRSVPPLFMLIVGIIQAMQGMMWVLVLTAVVLYVFALLAVKLIGHGMMFGGPDMVPEEVAIIFPTVPEAIFVLFMAMNGSSDPLEPMFRILPGSRLFFVIYMVLSSWAILSILTAVISENMISATEIAKEEQVKETEERDWNSSMKKLQEIMCSVDANGTGEIESHEFYRLLQDEQKAAELCKAAGGLKQSELSELFDCLSSINDGEPLPVDNFVEGLRTENLPVRRRETYLIEKRLAKMDRAIEEIRICVMNGNRSNGNGTALMDDNNILHKEDIPVPSFNYSSKTC